MFSGARKIIIKEEVFFWKVTSQKNIIVQRESTGEKKESHWAGADDRDFKITPKAVRRFILRNYFNETETDKEVFTGISFVPIHIWQDEDHKKDLIYIGKFNYKKRKEVYLTEEEARDMCSVLNLINKRKEESL